MQVKEESEKAGLKLNIQKTEIMASNPITSWQIDGETVRDFIFLGSKITADGDCSHEIKRCLAPWKKSYDQPRQHIKKQRYYYANKGPSNQDYGFSSSYVWMWELDYKESWAPKIWCFWTVVLENTLESPLDYKEIQPVHPKGDQSWIFIRRTDVFELWCLRRLLSVPWTTRRYNQSILKEINPNIHWKYLCWSWSSNTLATSCKGLTHWKRP